jgi:hypothetical protein
MPYYESTRPLSRRWRLQWWVAANPNATRKAWWYSNCLLCACNRAQALAQAACMVARADKLNARWTVAKPHGHLNDVEIVATWENMGSAANVRHTCGTTAPGTLGV